MSTPRRWLSEPLSRLVGIRFEPSAYIAASLAKGWDERGLDWGFVSAEMMMMRLQSEGLLGGAVGDEEQCCAVR